ncbi:MAG: SUMF1/EgtB/PvdO family nonheme iron enzyme [Pseudomonadota bacterium]
MVGLTSFETVKILGLIRAQLIIITGLTLVLSAADSVAAGEPDRAKGFELVTIPGGLVTTGDPAGEADEILATRTVDTFHLMRKEVTVGEFRQFVSDSGYVTDAERHGRGWVWRGDWREVSDATWRNPRSPREPNLGTDEHPVVQVSQRDASRFCAHYAMRLPSEAEWEYAARGANDNRRFPWGDHEPQPSERFANFGTVSCCAPDATDGYLMTAPVGSYPAGASPFGILDMAGNVWEWTADPFPGRPDEVALRGGGWGNNPYCLRVSYRHGNPPDIGLEMVGFRCAADALSSAPTR